MKTIRKRTTVRNAVTLAGNAISRGMLRFVSPIRTGRKTTKANIAMNNVVINLLTRVLYFALEMSCLTSLRPPCGSAEPARSEKMD